MLDFCKEGGKWNIYFAEVPKQASTETFIGFKLQQLFSSIALSLLVTSSHCGTIS